VRELKKSKGKNKTPKAASSTYWGDETFEAIPVNFGVLRQLSIIVSYIKFGSDGSRGFQSADP
jgi:hypothetical protein